MASAELLVPPSWATTWRRAARWAMAKSNACRVVLLGCAAPVPWACPGLPLSGGGHDRPAEILFRALQVPSR